MRQDALARRTDPDAEPVSASPTAVPAQTDYDALCAALGATARGRAFLDEHARRARQKETALALQALSRLEEQLRKRDSEAEGAARFHGELRALRSAIVSARTNFTRFEGMLAKRETVMALFDMLELRITEMLAEAPAEPEPQAANENELLAAAETQATLAATETQATLVAVHAALAVDEPPPPSAPHRDLEVEALVKVDPPRAMAQVEGRTPEPQAPMVVALAPHRNLHSGDAARGPACADEREKRTLQAPLTPALSEAESFPAEIFAPPPRPEPVPARQQDIIALINALSQAEKIALFS